MLLAAKTPSGLAACDQNAMLAVQDTILAGLGAILADQYAILACRKPFWLARTRSRLFRTSFWLASTISCTAGTLTILASHTPFYLARTSDPGQVLKTLFCQAPK